MVQHTGDSRLLPDAEGLFRFRTLDEAASYLAAAETDYAGHAAAARALVEEHFDAEKIIGRMLDTATAGLTRRRFQEPETVSDA